MSWEMVAIVGALLAVAIVAAMVVSSRSGE